MAGVIDDDGNFGIHEGILVRHVPDSSIEFNRFDAESQPLELFQKRASAQTEKQRLTPPRIDAGRMGDRSCEVPTSDNPDSVK